MGLSINQLNIQFFAGHAFFEILSNTQFSLQWLGQAKKGRLSKEKFKEYMGPSPAMMMQSEPVFPKCVWYGGSEFGLGTPLEIKVFSWENHQKYRIFYSIFIELLNLSNMTDHKVGRLVPYSCQP